MFFSQNPKWCLDGAVAIHLFRESFEPFFLELFLWLFMALLWILILPNVWTGRIVQQWIYPKHEPHALSLVHTQVMVPSCFLHKAHTLWSLLLLLTFFVSPELCGFGFSSYWGFSHSWIGSTLM